MGANPIDPVNVDAYHLLMVTYYAMSVGVTVYAIFGLVRTAATRLPIPRGKLLDPDIMPVDVTSKLYSFTGRGRKVLKMAQFLGICIFGLLCWLDVLYVTYDVGDTWFVWTLLDTPLAVVIHVLVLLAAALPLAIRARRHANKFEGYKLAADA
jgi:hypothetical protein